MTHIYFIAILMTGFFLQACGNLKSDKDCSKFKTGEFIYRFRGQQGEFSFSIIRNDSVQTEINPNTGDISKLSINWTDPCNYELKLIENTSNYPDSIQKMRKSIILKNEIISTSDEYYIFKSKRDNSDVTLTDTLWIKK
jgi:hypothetical protein